MRSRPARIGCLLALVAFAGACEVWPGEGNARIEATRIEMDDDGKAIDLWATIRFERLPESGDPRDVKIHFVGNAARFQQDFDWEYIATHDHVRLSDGTRYAFDRSVPGSPPVLGTPVDVHFRVLPKNQLVGEAKLALHLYWAGERQHFQKVDVSKLYTAY